MSDGWIEWRDGMSAPHPGTLVEVDYMDCALRETRLAGGINWQWAGKRNGGVSRYRIVRPPLDFHTTGAPIRADDVQVAGDHYKTLAVQPWAAMQAWMTAEQFAGYLRGCALKYLARAGSKGPTLEEYRKARHYLDKLIETMESQ